MDRRGHFVVYQGKEYSADSIGNGRLRLFSRDEADLARGFSPRPRGGFVKDVAREEVQENFYRYVRGMYRGQEVSLTQEGEGALQGQLLITLLNFVLPDVWQSLGFTEAERGVYEKWVSPDELERVWEEKRPQ